MNPELWRRVEELFQRARELPQEQRADFVARSGEAEEVQREVLRWLSGGADSKFIEPPTVGGGVPPMPDDPTEWIGRRFGDFELLEQIGRGGMGIVFRARQIGLRREVALKLLPPSPFVLRKNADRFEREAEAAARLHHPNVVAIHSVGREGEVRWFAMELVRGLDLAHEIEHLAGRASKPRARMPAFTSSEYVATVARVVEQAADALAYAHAQGVVHRDVKPSNLLRDEHGNVRVVDFGLARDASLGSITEVGEQAGTAHYMSPEQLLKDLHAVDARTDVYSLGVVLFELLTLRRPYDGATRDEIYDSIKRAEAPRLRKLEPRVPRDLELVCNTAMARELRDRYASAADFRDDLQRFLRHEAVVAKAPSLARRTRRFAAKRRVPLLAGGAALIALALGFGFAEKREREKSWAADREVFERALALPSWDESVGELVDARNRLAARVRTSADLPATGQRLLAQLQQRFSDDREARVRRGVQLLEAARAGRTDAARFGKFLSSPSESDLAQALRILGDARAIYWDDAEVTRLADVRSSFPRVTLRLAAETQARAARAAEAQAYLRPIDSVLGTVGERQPLGRVPFTDEPVPPGYWRIEVEVPDWGIAELTRHLYASVQVCELVARVLPDAAVHAGMKSIDGGRFSLRTDSPLGCRQVGDAVELDAFWIDEAELSNREFVEFLEQSGSAPPLRWVRLGFRGDWRELPLGDAAERWLELPIVGINLAQATACAEWFGKRLPSHLELERALRGPAAVFTPSEGLARPEDGGRCNVDGPDVRIYAGAGGPESVAGSYAHYLRHALPVRADGYRQQPEGLFHAWGNVAELTESMLVEAQDGMLVTFPWTRINLGGPWDARSANQSLAAHPYDGTADAYTRDYVGLRCATSARH